MSFRAYLNLAASNQINEKISMLDLLRYLRETFESNTTDNIILIGWPYLKRSSNHDSKVEVEHDFIILSDTNIIVGVFKRYAGSFISGDRNNQWLIKSINNDIVEVKSGSYINPWRELSQNATDVTKTILKSVDDFKINDNNKYITFGKIQSSIHKLVIFSGRVFDIDNIIDNIANKNIHILSQIDSLIDLKTIISSYGSMEKVFGQKLSTTQINIIISGFGFEVKLPYTGNDFIGIDSTVTDHIVKYKVSRNKQQNDYSDLNKVQEIENENNYNCNVATEIIGYDDVKLFLINNMLYLFDENTAHLFGIQKPAGILLYGPPGCGKTYWANMLVKMLQLTLKEVTRSMFGSSYVDGALTGIRDIMNECINNAPIVIFFDEFDSIANDRIDGNPSPEDNKVVNELLQSIPKQINAGNIIIAATNFLNRLDPAIIRAGRFDNIIPIFPPLPAERIELLLHKIRKNVPEKSPMLKILDEIGALSFEYWVKYSDSLILFSNSNVESLSNRIKIAIANNFKADKTGITEDILKNCVSEEAQNITENQLHAYSDFYEYTHKQFKECFKERLSVLKQEIEAYKSKHTNKNRIGFSNS